MMNGDDSKGREKVRRLMMAALDGEISDAERAELDRALEGDPDLRLEYDRMGQVKEVTGSMAFREPPEEVWGQYWTSVYNKLERGIGWIFISIGTVVLLAWGAWESVSRLFGENGMPLFAKLAIMAVAVGFFILAVSVIREKMFTRLRDPYKEIER